jgi:hypothetical protein
MKIGAIMSRSRIIAISLVTALVLLVAYLALKPRTTSDLIPQQSVTPTPSSQVSATPSPTGPISSKNGAITITSPASGSTIHNGSIVTGTAQVFEGQFNYELRGSNNIVLASGLAHVDGDSATHAPYSIKLVYSIAAGTSQIGILKLYDLSAKDGSEIDVLSVNIILERE